MSTEIQTTLTQEQRELLGMMTPHEQGFTRNLFPRLGMYSQDKFEGKGKSAVLVKEAGVFYTETETDEKDAEGKKVWAKNEIGNTIEGIILYNRKQLSYYDEATQKYTSSPIYDSADEVIPLFLDKKEVAKGTPAELKAMYAYVDPKDNKTKSRLEDTRILYVLRGGVIYQMNLRGSSMWVFSTYAKSVLVSACVTRFSSESKENGAIAWNQMTFDAVREITEEEANEVIKNVKQIVTGIQTEKEYYASLKTTSEALKVAVEEQNAQLPQGKGMDTNDF